MMTFKEVCERLADLEEVILMELLQLESQDLVERCKDIIEYRYDYILAQFEEEEYDE